MLCYVIWSILDSNLYLGSTCEIWNISLFVVNYAYWVVFFLLDFFCLCVHPLCGKMLVFSLKVSVSLIFHKKPTSLYNLTKWYSILGCVFSFGFFLLLLLDELLQMMLKWQCRLGVLVVTLLLLMLPFLGTKIEYELG